MSSNFMKFSAVFLFCLWGLATKNINCKIVSSTLEQDIEPKIVQLKDDGLRKALHSERVKRGLSNTPTHTKPYVHATNLTDQTHNEAIVHWSGDKSQVIFVLTREHKKGAVTSSSLYRSEDYGETFPKVKNVPKNLLLRYYFISKANKQKLIFTDIVNKTLLITTDDGDTFQDPVKLSFSPDIIKFHSTKEDWVLGYDLRKNQLHVSQDLGHNWMLVTENANTRFFWADPKHDKNMSSVHVEIQDISTGNYEYKLCGFPNCPDQGFDNELSKNIDYYSLLIVNEYIFIQKSTHFSSTLHVSYKRQPFKATYFPLDINAKDFNVINADEGQVFIAASSKERTVNLYLSDSTGQFYIESLRDLVSFDGYSAELYEVKGMTGIYIANVRHDVHGAKSSITFDQGKSWKRLTPPKLDANKKPTNCKLEDGCQLHLHLTLSTILNGVTRPLSEENAPGIIMAHGNVGKGVSSTNTSMYLSSDAGLTWREVFKGNHIYNIIDQGGAMVAVPLPNGYGESTAKVIMYSCTEGNSWDTYQLGMQNVQIQGVLNEPGITTRIVSIYGHRNKSVGWTIIKVDFSPILSKQCKDSDFDEWNPHPLAECLMGQKLTYQRRKPLSECYIGKDYVHSVKNTTCDCKSEDYECDYGYKRVDKNCVHLSWFNPSHPPFECPEGSTYINSTGYRKIASDKCKDITHMYGVSTKCPKSKPDQLGISTISSQTAQAGIPVKFHLHQKIGSKISTQYSWKCDNNSTDVKIITGFNKAKSFNCTFKKHGWYTVSVNASNALGSANASLLMHVEDKIVGLYVEEPHGAKINYPVQFVLWPVTDSWDAFEKYSVHFRWNFGEVENEKSRYVTFERTGNHTYLRPGNYTVTIEAINSVSSFFKRTTVVVYGTLTTVQLSVDDEVKQIRGYSVVWKETFADRVKQSLMRSLDILPERLEVVIPTKDPTKIDVSIVPLKQEAEEDPSIDLIVQKILDYVKHQSLYIQMIDLDGTLQKVHIIKAIVLHDDVPAHSKHRKNLVAVFVCIPILLIAVFISALVLLYYKRKFSHLRRYSMLQQSDAEDRLLGADDDDDDPPLDLNPGRGSGGILVVANDDDNQSDLFQPG